MGEQAKCPKCGYRNHDPRPCVPVYGPTYPTPVTDLQEIAGWMRREQEAYDQGRADAARPEQDEAVRLADAVRRNFVAAVRLQQDKITDDEYDATTRAVMEALQAFDATPPRGLDVPPVDLLTEAYRSAFWAAIPVSQARQRAEKMHAYLVAALATPPPAAPKQYGSDIQRSPLINKDYSPPPAAPPALDVERLIWPLIESYGGTVEIDNVQRFREHLRRARLSPDQEEAST